MAGRNPYGLQALSVRLPLAVKCWSRSRPPACMPTSGTPSLACPMRCGSWGQGCASRATRSLAQIDRITSGDYAAITGLTVGGARGALDRLVDEGHSYEASPRAGTLTTCDLRSP